MQTRKIFTATAVLLLLAGCGGGDKAIVGIGNSGNRQSAGAEIAEDLGKGLADTLAIPKVTDETLLEIYAVLLEKAREGDQEAALSIVELAVQQREE